MTDLDTTLGQAEPTPVSAGTIGNAPDAPLSGSGDVSQTSAPMGAPGTDVESSFFDPASIRGKPELEAAYKQMQGAFTKRMQDFAQHRQKVDAYDRFARDPINTVSAIAQQMGFKLVQAGNEQPKDWNPSTWEDVLTEAEKRAESRVLKRMEPVYNELRDLKKQSVEGYLDSQFPDWRTYEDDMLRTLQEHPTLANQPDKLYRLSVPEDVWEARATKAAMSKIQQRQQSASMAGATSTTRPTVPEKTGPLSFDQAVEAARRKVSAMGLRPGS